jgi:hypothetical protein
MHPSVASVKLLRARRATRGYAPAGIHFYLTIWRFGSKKQEKNDNGPGKVSMRSSCLVPAF